MSLPAPHDTLMYREAAEAADVIAAQFARNQVAVETLAASLRAAPPPFVVTCARGSSDHAATYAKYLFETQLGIVTASASPSVVAISSRIIVVTWWAFPPISRRVFAARQISTESCWIARP